ncbi:uncharacterized protein LOC124355052 [Homalodisca vitripennis]|uniref:uncharacterized protein LOC124355052 n=1 Tax=Homalodisca vitripennis TaxID=197043 RepID=UPI001EEC9885|nr:uncharacterized protein LOC124355052 [Homalodisca vitripennis]
MILKITVISLLTQSIHLPGISANEDQSRTELHVTYCRGADGYHKLPTSVHEINEKSPPDWVIAGYDEELKCDIYSYPNDPRMMLLFDQWGNPCAMRLGYIIEDLPKMGESNNREFTYRYDDKPMYRLANYWDTDIWETTFLFTSPETLKNGGRKETGGIFADEVWMPLTGEYVRIPDHEYGIMSIGFTKQVCHKGMGNHYFFNMTPWLDCHDWLGPYVHYENRKLVGIANAPFGSFTYLHQNWFEIHDPRFVDRVMPFKPGCFNDWLEYIGTTAIHIYLVANPRNISCDACLFG